MASKKAKLSISIDRDLYDKLTKYAEERNITRSAAANRIFSGTLPQIVNERDIVSVNEELLSEELRNERIQTT